MGANMTDNHCQDRVKPGQCSAWVGSLYAFIYMQMYFCIFPYWCYSACVSAASATHGACTSLAPSLFTCCQTCTSTRMWCIHCSRAAACLVPHCLQAWWQGPRAHRPAACSLGRAQPPQVRMGPLLTHLTALIPWDHHGAETCLGTGGEGQRTPQSPLSLSGAAPSSSVLLACLPQHPGVPCVKLGGFSPCLPWCQRGEESADSPELVSSGAPSLVPGNAGARGWAGWVRACGGTGRAPGPLPLRTRTAPSPGGHLQGLSWGIPLCFPSARANSGFAQAWPPWGRCH